MGYEFPGMNGFMAPRHDAHPLRVQVQRGRHADRLRRHGVGMTIVQHHPRRTHIDGVCAEPALPVVPSVGEAEISLRPDARLESLPSQIPSNMAWKPKSWAISGIAGIAAPYVTMPVNPSSRRTLKSAAGSPGWAAHEETQPGSNRSGRRQSTVRLRELWAGSATPMQKETALV